MAANGCGLKTHIAEPSLRKRINSSEDIINSLESLAHISIELNQLSDADSYLRQLDPLIRANGNRLDALDVLLAQGRIAAARRQDQQAEALFRQVEADPASRSPCASTRSTSWPGSSNNKAASTTRRRCTRPRWPP